MSEAIYGKNVVLEILDGADYFPVLCGDDCSFNRSPELIPVTSSGSGLFTETMVRRESWSMSVSGLTKVANDTAVTFFYMLQTAVRRSTHTVRMTFTDDLGAAKQISGDILIGEMSITGPVADFSQCSIQMKGTGPFEISTIEPPVVVEYDIISDWWTTEAGDTGIDGVSAIYGYSLEDDDVPIEVDMNGSEYNLVNFTPVSGYNQCQFLTGPARIIFPPDIIFDGTQTVFVEFKRPV